MSPQRRAAPVWPESLLPPPERPPCGSAEPGGKQNRSRREYKHPRPRLPPTVGLGTPCQCPQGPSPHQGDPVPLPGPQPWCHHSPASRSPPRAPGAGRGWRGARKGLPCRIPAGSPAVTHGCSLPTPRQRGHTPPRKPGPAPGTPRRKERHAPRREGAPEETGEPRRREPRSGAAAAREGEARTHVSGGRRPPASMGVPGTARAGRRGAAAGAKRGHRMNSPDAPLLSHHPPRHLLAPNRLLCPQDGVGGTTRGPLSRHVPYPNRHQTTCEALAAEGRGGRQISHNLSSGKLPVLRRASFSHSGLK